MNYFFLLDKDYKILVKVFCDCPEDGYIHVTEEEFKQSDYYYKFNPETREFSDLIKVEEVVEESEHEKITKETYETASLSAEDNLLNMDLLTAIDDKLTLIMEHLGI